MKLYIYPLPPGGFVDPLHQRPFRLGFKVVDRKQNIYAGACISLDAFVGSLTLSKSGQVIIDLSDMEEGPRPESCS